MNNLETMKLILEKIKEYKRILIFRHFRPDGDAVGSTKGLQAILKATFPEKEILLQNRDFANYLTFMGGEDEVIDAEYYTDSLGIIIDTGTADRASNKEFKHCREVIKIDHHIDNNPYGDISWVEDHRSSACEMIVAFYDAFKDQLVMTKEAATYLYTGMVTDSGRFHFEDVSGDTLRCAAILLDQGIDTATMFANLDLEDFDDLKFKAYVYKNMKITENGVAYIFVDKKMQKKFNLTTESASSAIGYMSSIKGCLCWIAFIYTGDKEGTIRVRLRSRFAHINTIAEKYRGGGHACASGATVYNKKEIKALISDADAHIKEYKNTHEGWL